MKKPILLLITLTALLAACAAPPADLPAASPGPSVEATRTRRPSQTPGPTKTLIPSHTPKPSSTITPIRPLSSNTPTFDVRTILTATPEMRTECPKVSSAQNANLDFLNLYSEEFKNRSSIEENFLNFLNLYGAKAFYQAAKSPQAKGIGDVALQDLTNDGEPEIAIGARWFYIFGCRQGEYVILFSMEPDTYLQSAGIFVIKDVNRDNIPEITLRTATFSQGGHTYQIYSWKGDRFANLLLPERREYPDSGEIWVEATGKIEYKDINNDFVQELILDSGIPVWSNYHSGFPWRNERTIYAWNGRNYLPGHREFAQPEFRFQAVQDGDLALSQQEYDKAIELYQQAIFNAELQAFSPEIRKNLQDAWLSGLNNSTNPTPTFPAPDITEYPRLAAYAYYRMVILHTLLGEMDSAQVKYASLQEKFPANSPGHPYAEMATGFWEAWQSSGRMYDACAAAIAYADAHPEILVPLGSDYHGWQSHHYQPADVCPFR
jgi:tetratricopeptide (TPR) repeat protein